MRYFRKALPAVVSLLVALLPPPIASAQESRLTLFVKGESSFPVKEMTFVVTDINGKILDKYDWSTSKPLYREFILPTANYKINIPGPISAIDIGTASGVSTFLVLAPYSTEAGEKGVQITSWRGQPSDTVENAIRELKTYDPKALSPVRLNVVGNASLRFSTDPPWPNPFEKPSPTPTPAPTPKQTP